MKTVLFFDTETTGLPNWSLPSEDPSQPHIVQLAAELCIEETGETLASMNMMIRPDGWVIPDDVAKIHGITTERAAEFGFDALAVFDTFFDIWSRATFRCAHNASFDMRMVRIAIYRHAPNEGYPTPDGWKAAPEFCTMSSSQKIVNLPPSEKMLATGRRGPKSPNLGEAYQFFTGKTLEGAHNAAVDVAACKAIYYALRERGATK